MININTTMKPALLFSTLAIGLGSLAAQEKKDVALDDPRIVRVAPTPTVIEKFTALKMRMKDAKLNWVQVYNSNKIDFDPDNLDDTSVQLPVALGIRITDGIIAIIARNAESLNEAAEDIEQMSKKLGVSDKDLARAKQVRAFANRGSWNRVYMELGWLQKDVMATLDREGNSNRRALLLASGWLQAAHITSSIVAKNYNEDRSTLVREPIMLNHLIKELGKVTPAQKAHPTYKTLLKSISDISKLVDTPVGEPISKDALVKVSAATALFRGAAAKP